MTEEGLAQELAKVENYEREGLERWMGFLERMDGKITKGKLWEEYKAEAEESLSRWLRKMNMGKPILLEYKIKETGEWGTPPAEPGQGRMLSRELLAEERGIGKWLAIQKHPRFGTCFLHTHTFLEMNYCYSGRFVNLVNGKPYEMEPGDLLLMEPGCVHKISVLSEGDIQINFVWFPSAMLTVLDKIIPGACELAQFLIRALYRSSGKANYVFFRTGKEERIRKNVNEILMEYFEPERTASEVLVGYLIQELFARLWRFGEENPDQVKFGYRPNSVVAKIIFHIREHCVDCTRESVADEFGYSGSRISNLLSENVGKGFVDLRNEFRLERIEEMLSTTALPVQKIAEQCGFSNQTHFYRLYREHFGRLPRAEKNRNRKTKNEHSDSENGNVG